MKQSQMLPYTSGVLKSSADKEGASMVAIPCLVSQCQMQKAKLLARSPETEPEIEMSGIRKLSYKTATPCLAGWLCADNSFSEFCLPSLLMAL